jgi:hypothetical protein
MQPAAILLPRWPDGDRDPSRHPLFFAYDERDETQLLRAPCDTLASGLL